MPNIGPRMSAIGKASVIGPSVNEFSKICTGSSRTFDRVDAVILAITMGVIALNEKCLNIASCANITPTIGALKPAEMAAATPQPINMSVENLLPVS